MSGITTLIFVAVVMFCILGGVTLLAHIYNLNSIKSKTVGDGQHGTARWATKSEIRKIYNHIPFTPAKWREQAAKGETPTVSRIVKRRFFKKKNDEPEEVLPQGIVVGCTGGKHHTTAMVDTGDVHALMIGAAGVGKTAFWLYPCIEYACASGMSVLSTDTKGDVMRNYGNSAKGYGYNVSVIDLRNPTRSNGNNLLRLVNKYMDLYQQENKLIYKAKAEKYAKIISKTIILSGMDAASFGQNAYFYDAAEGLLTATTIGGSSYSTAGQWIEWKANVKETGLYKISFRCRQNYLSGAFVTRKLYVNGEIQYKELSNIKINYDSNWQMVTLENPVLLQSGDNILRLEVAMGDLSSIAEEIENAVTELNYAYRQIIMVTGVNPDPYRNYKLEVYAPEAIEIFKKYQTVIADCNDRLIEVTGKRGSTNGILQTVVELLKKMNDKVYDIQNNLSVFKDDIASLSTWVSDIKKQSLEIDKIYIHDSDYELPKSDAGFFARLKHEILSFISTFIEDYTSIGVMDENGDKIEVWIATGRDQANILNNLITEYFSPTYNISVDLKLVQGQLLAATASGTGPDVALQIGNSEPVNYALRKAVIDLKQFSDYEKVADRFYKSAIVPFELSGGVYGLPETQTFPVMFIRTDIFEELSLTVPTDWDKFLNVVGKLQKKNMTGGITPLSNTDDSSMAIFLLQNGGSFYNENGSASGLDSNESIEAFKKLTSLFADYSFPTQYNALNRFRSGEMPILINDYTLYSQLVVGAPEIDGLWKMYPVPGTIDSEGVLHNEVASTGTACMIMSTTENKENSWKFLEWWTSAEAQRNYGQDMELLLGASARYCTANKVAFAKIAWDKDEYNVLLKQWDSVKGIPQVAGGYFTPRHLNNAFRRVINQKQDPKETLLMYVKNINDEIAYKRNELGIK